MPLSVPSCQSIWIDTFCGGVACAALGVPVPFTHHHGLVMRPPEKAARAAQRIQGGDGEIADTKDRLPCLSFVSAVLKKSRKENSLRARRVLYQRPVPTATSALIVKKTIAMLRV